MRVQQLPKPFFTVVWSVMTQSGNVVTMISANRWRYLLVQGRTVTKTELGYDFQIAEPTVGTTITIPKIAFKSAPVVQVLSN